MKTKPHYHFYLKKGADASDFAKAHPEFKESDKFEGDYGYTAENHKYSLWLIKKPRLKKRYAFRFQPNISTAYIMKLMELYKEGWIEPSDHVDDYVMHNREITDGEWKIIQELRKGKEDKQ